MRDDLPAFYQLFDKPDRPPSAEPANVHPIDPARSTRYALAALDAELDRVRTAVDGTRNDTLNRAGFSLAQLVAAGHLTEHDVCEALKAAAVGNGLSEHEVDATLRSSLGAGKDHPRVVPQLPPVPSASTIETPDLEQVENETFWTARPLLSHLHTFARARRVSPWAVLGVTLARIVTATPPFVTLPPLVGGHASLNLFVGLVGTSGSGKGAAEAVSAEAVDVGHIETHTTGSGEGIAHGYMKRTKEGPEQHTTAVLFSVPEIDTLGALGQRQGATLLPELRRGWSGEALGFSYADPNKRLPVPAHKYRLCLVAGIQPARAHTLLDDTDGGTPQRFLWFPATDTEAPDLPPAAPDPISWKIPYPGFVGPSGFNVLDVCDQAVATIDDARLSRLRNQGEALDGHALLAQLKTAAALALAEARLTITDDDWQLASTIARKSAATRAAVARTLADAVTQRNHGRAMAEADRAVIVTERVEDAAVKRVCTSVMRRLRRENDWVGGGEVKRSVAARDRVHLRAAVERLLDAGQIEAEEAASAGVKYRLTKVKK